MESMFQEADRLISEKAIGEAFNMLTSIITEEPTFGKAYNHLGWIYDTQYKDSASAERNYKMAIQYMPNYFASYYNYAMVLSGLQRWDDLTALLNKAMEMPGINKGTIYNEFGIMYEAQRKYKEAIEAYKNYAAATYNNQQLNTAIESIERCKKKMTILGS